MIIMIPIQALSPASEEPIRARLKQLKDYTTIHVRISKSNTQMAATIKSVSIRRSAYIVDLRVWYPIICFLSSCHTMSWIIALNLVRWRILNRTVQSSAWIPTTANMELTLSFIPFHSISEHLRFACTQLRHCMICWGVVRGQIL